MSERSAASTVAVAPREPGSASTPLSWLRLLLSYGQPEGGATLLVLLAAWQGAAHVLPPFLFPPLQKIGAAILNLAVSPAALETIGLTYLRILGALAVSFVLGSVLGITAGFVRGFERALLPLMQLLQGVPAVCWAIFAILWFGGVELRVGFVVVVATLPSFFFQLRDGVRAISRELWDMTLAWRPSRLQVLRKLILPALAPAMLTAARINLGNGTRITITAELLGGISGIGYQLRYAQEQFRMDLAIGWTVALIVFVLITDAVMVAIERRTLRWRRNLEAAA